MADDLRKLLDHIVKTFLVHDEMVAIDQEASASETGDAIESGKKRAAQREYELADDLADSFASGISRARLGLIVLDDRNADENKMADALIQFLVRADLATSRAVETEPNHYRYRILINWSKLELVANDAGIDLDQTVRQLST